MPRLDPREQAMVEEFSRLLAPHLKTMFPVSLNAASVVLLIGNLQLALRHPHNDGAPAEFARGLVHELIERFAGLDPRIAAYLRMGDNPARDFRIKPPGVN